MVTQQQRRQDTFQLLPGGLETSPPADVAEYLKKWSTLFSEQFFLLNRKLEHQSEQLQRAIDTIQSEFDLVRENLVDDRYEAPLTVKQLAEVLGKSPSTIRRWERNGIISCERIPNEKKESLLFHLRDVKKDLARHFKRSE